MKKFATAFAMVLSLTMLLSTFSVSAAEDAVTEACDHTNLYTISYWEDWEYVDANNHIHYEEAVFGCNDCGAVIDVTATAYEAHDYYVASYMGEGMHSGKFHTWDCWYKCVCGDSYRGTDTKICPGDGTFCPYP